MFRTILGALACACALAAAAPPPAAAQTLASEPAPRRTIYVPRDKSLSFRLGEPASRIVIAQPEIAKVTATSDRSFYVQGIDFGSTNLLVYGSGGRLAEVIDVRIGYDAEGLQQDLVAAFPGEPIRVRNLGESLMLTGDVSSTGVERRAEEIARKYAPDSVVSRITVRAAEQVVLEVRVIEATRSALHDAGFSGTVQNGSFHFSFGGGLIGASPPTGVLTTTGGSGSTSIDLALVALEEKGLVHTLARPNLVAISGEKATFHAGGEFPYPVPQQNNVVSLEFRKYGVELTFTPVVEDNGMIRLDVEPSVSQLDFTNSLRVQGFTVPGLVIRRTKTVVELRDGQSLAVGGLLQRDYANSLRQIPGIGKIPILGALTRSAQWKRSETELVVLVTPRLATAADVNGGAEVKAKALEDREASDRDLYLLGKSSHRPMSSPDGQ